MGQNYSIKYRLLNSKFYFFYYFGMSGIVGLSYEFKKSEFLSFGAGLRAKQIVRLDEKTNARFETATLAWNFGIFYDRNNSLLFSAVLSGVNYYQSLSQANFNKKLKVWTFYCFRWYGQTHIRSKLKIYASWHSFKIFSKLLTKKSL